MKNNKFIAEFMECTHPFNEITDATLYKVSQGTFELDELKYHKSWDWLMPVVEKIYSLDAHIDFFRVINLEATYKAVVEFIKQYNNED